MKKKKYQQPAVAVIEIRVSSPIQMSETLPFNPGDDGTDEALSKKHTGRGFWDYEEE